MKIMPLLFACLLFAGCAHRDPFNKGDVLVSASDGTVLGTVMDTGYHSFENGAAGESILVELPSGKDAWYSLDTTKGTYIVKQ